jgi:hypothetical protein
MDLGFFKGTRLPRSVRHWTILSADGISDQGQIVGRAANTLAFGPVILDPEAVKYR